MLFKRRSPVTGRINEQEIDVTQEQVDRWVGGMLAQNAFKGTTPQEREFIISGCTQEDWKMLYGDD